MGPNVALIWCASSNFLKVLVDRKIVTSNFSRAKVNSSRIRFPFAYGSTFLQVIFDLFNPLSLNPAVPLCSHDMFSGG